MYFAWQFCAILRKCASWMFDIHNILQKIEMFCKHLLPPDSSNKCYNFQVDIRREERSVCKYWLLIGRQWCFDLDTGLWLVERKEARVFYSETMFIKFLFAQMFLSLQCPDVLSSNNVCWVPDTTHYLQSYPSHQG